MSSSKRKLMSLQDLCLESYLEFLETECKTWIDLRRSGSRLLQTAMDRMIPGLQARALNEFSRKLSLNQCYRCSQQ